MNLKKSYTNSGDTLLLFIDEKDSFHPTKFSKKGVYPELFVLLGVSILELDYAKLVERFNVFKAKIRPDFDPMDWEIKGAKGFEKELKEWCSKEEMKKVWKHFAEFIGNLDVPYTIHGVFSNKKAVVGEREYSPPLDWNKEGKFSFMRLNLAFLLTNVQQIRQAESSIHTDLPNIDVTMHSLKVY